MGSFAVHRMTQLEQQVDRLTRDLAQARAEVASLTTYRDGLDKNVTELEAENERLRAEKEEMRSTVADWIRMHHENGLMRTALTNIVRLDQHEKRTCIDADPSGCTYEIEMIDGPCAHIARHAVEQSAPPKEG
jgi:septal ring factor EnvC (AmiA/AmiB activator)